MDLKDIAILLSMLKAYHDEVVKNAEDCFAFNEQFDFKEADEKVRNIKRTIGILMDDFKDRMNN